MPLAIVTPVLPNGTTGVAYTQALQATGGTSPYTWTLLSGTLPQGLALSSGGVISGTPDQGGSRTAHFTVKVTDSSSATATATCSLTTDDPVGGVTGWDLFSTLQQQGAYVDYYRAQAPVACPYDGTPLLQGPPENTITLYCPFDGFKYPDDWDVETMAGM